MMKVVDGDVDKFGILYERYKKSMFGYFFKLTRGDTAVSEDLAHAVFYKALKYKHSYRGTGTFAKWIFHIAHNIGVDYYRKMKRISSSEYLSHLHQEDKYENNDIEREEDLSLLSRAMGYLSHEDREVLILGKIKELRYSEIAEITGSTESAVKTRIFRALKRLKDIYLKLETTQYERERLQ
jgi:RNA polymerase sigma factor (sigma-70 family)